MIRNIAEGGTYVPTAGEHLLQLVNAGDVPLYVGIRKGEYMIAPAAGAPQFTYVLTEEQWVRLQQQMATATYKSWVASGLLTLSELSELVPPEEPPAEEPPAEAEEPPAWETPGWEPPSESRTPE
jgi:hypothetical protein